jgi:hypothetical protein
MKQTTDKPDRSDEIKFRLALGFDHNFRVALENIGAPFAETAAAFTRNIDRIVHLVAMPPNVLHWSMLMGSTMQIVSDKMGIGSEIGFDTLKEPDAANAHNAIAKLVGVHREALKNDENFRVSKWNNSVTNFENLLDDEIEGRLAIAVDAIFQSQISAAWTAFESLATDCWIEAVNQRPQTLGEKAWFSTSGDEEPEASEGKTSRDSIPLSILRDHGYDVSKSIGTIVHRGRKFKFNRLKGIRTAFTRVFDNSVNSAFPKFKELLALELLRNVIVHRGGIVDATFLAESKELPIPLGQEKDHPLKISGADAAWCVDVSTESAVALITYVSQWLNSKKT